MNKSITYKLTKLRIKWLKLLISEDYQTKNIDPVSKNISEFVAHTFYYC